MVSIKKELFRKIPTDILFFVLEINEQIVSSQQELYDRVADCIVYGTLPKCDCIESTWFYIK
jgi:hypothetical protein